MSDYVLIVGVAAIACSTLSLRHSWRGNVLRLLGAAAGLIACLAASHTRVQ